jgi:cell division protein FtsL
MVELIIVIVFLIYLGFREWDVSKHIRDLELKLMAKDPQEYAALKRLEKPIKEIKKENEDLIEPEDANPADAIRGILKE